MGQIEAEDPELFALEFENVCDHKISDEYDYRFNRTRTVSVITLEFAKIVEYDFVYTLTSTNVDQLALNMVTIYMTLRSWMSLIMGLIRQ